MSQYHVADQLIAAARKLRAMLERRKMTQREMCSLTGIDTGRLNRLLTSPHHGIRQLDQLNLIANQFGLEVQVRLKKRDKT